MPPRPKGYVGTGHETVGSDILAVLKCLNFPLAVLGAETTRRLENIQPDAWYPIGWLLELMELLDEKLGPSGLRRMGGTLFKLSHEARVKEVAHTAKDIIHGIDGMYHHANRGEKIGGWKVLKFEPGHAELEKNTPHHCVMEEGLLTEALRAMGAHATVTQTGCIRTGADVCTYVIKGKADAAWGS